MSPGSQSWRLLRIIVEIYGGKWTEQPVNPSLTPLFVSHFLQVLFEDAFGEPEGSHSIPGVWSMSYKTFGGVKNCCYIVLSVLCGCPLAFCWALEFACVQCCHIWCIGPCIKMWNMNFSCLKLFWSSCIHCMCDPCYEACALCLSLIRVQTKNG